MLVGEDSLFIARKEGEKRLSIGVWEAREEERLLGKEEEEEEVEAEGETEGEGEDVVTGEGEGEGDEDEMLGDKWDVEIDEL